ncbi:MAG: restriction endonuclease subunit S [Muribaculaceae bacterium]|nr:restriction endonuclease subunit S [Muribaculaceae bacterium]
METNYIRLKDYCSKIGSGATPKGGSSVYIDKGVSLIRSQNVYNLRFSYSGLAHINVEAAKKLNGVTVEQGDVLLNITGDSVARTCVVPDNVLPARVNQHVAIIRPKDELDSKYLNYYLASPAMQGYLLSIASTGASRNAITKGMIEKFVIPFPDKGSQRRIASILSAYDNLIENNTRRIRLLEQMAENIYKEWFVRFRFPGHENEQFENSKLGKLPASFKVVTMNDVFEYYIGGGWGNEEESEDFPISASVIRGADFPNVWHYDTSTCPRRYHKRKNYEARQLQDGDIILEISGGTAEQPVGRTVLVTDDMINRFEGGRVICASFCKLIRLKKSDISPYYYFYWMQYLYDTRIIDRFQLQSTGIINFKFEHFLKKGLLMMPPRDLQDEFDKIIIPIYKEINKLALQNEKLARQRDLLLPRLMSGKLEVM